MMILKACPKCHGDLSVENDVFSKTLFNRETDFACLQCGKRLSGAERSQMLGRIMRWQARQTAVAAA
jgi:hypothetical protein